MTDPTTRSSGQSQSIWSATVTPPSYPPLDGPRSVDICVVGAGIAGMSTAYMLAKAGRSVLVVDHMGVGGGTTGRTTAQITAIVDKGYAETEKLRGRDGARLTALSHMAAIDMIEQIVAAEQIDCGFTRLDGYLFPGDSSTDSDMTDELEAARRAGLAVELEREMPGDAVGRGPALRFARQAHFHPLAYLSGLARALERMGATIAIGTHIQKVSDSNGTVLLETDTGNTIMAQKVVLATHAPINDAVGYSTRMYGYMSYVIGLEVPKDSIPPMVAFDTDDPYHYIRIQPGTTSDTLIVGGEDHKTGQADDQEERYANLEQWARQHFPVAGALSYRWSGQVFNSFDGLALVGADLATPGVYVLTGQTGIGMTHSTLGAMLLTDLIMGRPNPWAELYDPARLPIRATGEVLSEGADILKQYTELLTGGDVSDASAIPPGSGAIMGWGPTKIAVYRDEQGLIHRRSALCTHLGCVVGWNDSEKTWDCPCHGSRYDCYGKVISGPAPADLSSAE